jgi:hypothetical protein
MTVKVVITTHFANSCGFAMGCVLDVVGSECE